MGRSCSAFVRALTSWIAITVSWVEFCVFCHFATHVLKRDAIMSTGVQKCSVPIIITSSARCGFVSPPSPAMRQLGASGQRLCCPLFAAAHSFAKAFLAHALTRCSALTRTSSRSSKSNFWGSILFGPTVVRGRTRHCFFQANLYFPLQSGSDILKPLRADTLTFLLTLAQFDQVSDTCNGHFPSVCVLVVALSGCKVPSCRDHSSQTKFHPCR